MGRSADRADRADRAAQNFQFPRNLFGRTTLHDPYRRYLEIPKIQQNPNNFLIAVVKNNYPELVDYLIRREKPTPDQLTTALYEAVQSRSIKTIPELVQAGAQVNAILRRNQENPLLVVI